MQYNTCQMFILDYRSFCVIIDVKPESGMFWSILWAIFQCITLVLHSGVVVSSLSSQQEDSGLNPGWVFPVFHVLLVHVSFLQALRLLPAVQNYCSD